MIDVSIILVSYNTCELTRNCLNSIYEKTTDVNFDIWVVDNDSKDGSVEMIKADFPQVNLIENQENKGFGAANNIAIEKSKAKYVFLLNTDTILINNAIKELFNFMEENEDCGACGGNLYNEKQEISFSYGNFPNFKSKIFETFGLSSLIKRINRKKSNHTLVNNTVREVDYISGADLMLRKTTLNETGAFDEYFFLYFEETELQFRIRKSEYKIYLVPSSKIIHLEGKSSKNKKLKSEIFCKSESYFYKKCYGLDSFGIKKILLIFSYSMKYPFRFKLLFNQWRNI